MDTNQVIEIEVGSFLDSFYSYLLQDGYWNKAPKDLKDLFPKNMDIQDIAFVLYGCEERYFADFTYFSYDSSGDTVSWYIPYGEIELQSCPESFENGYNNGFFLDDDSFRDWVVNDSDPELAYLSLPAISIVWDKGKLKRAIEDMAG